jgi:predicted TIM-barrel enzyme
MTLDEAVTATQDLIEAARAVKPDVIALAHGGPMENPEDVAYVLERTNAKGFVGASSNERLPVETAMIGAIKAFTQIPLDTRNRLLTPA